MNLGYVKAKAYINGKFVETENTIDVISPIDGNIIGCLPCVNKRHVDNAYIGSYKAFLMWKELKPEKRIKIVKTFADIFISNKQELANLMTIEIGKSFKDSLTEINRTYEYIMETIKVYENEFINPIIIDESIHNIKGKTGYFYNVPIGVVLAISPFNYPINLSIAKIIPSILTGNTVVFKPATYGALVASKIATYFDQAKILPGVFNLVIGKGSEIGDYIIENKLIAGATFTGSTNIGKNIAKKLPMKPLVLELGGKDVAIVTKNADLNLACKEIIKGAFSFSGQRCTAIKKVLVLPEIANKFVEMLLNEIKLLTIGNPFDNVDIVPVIDKKTLEYNIDLINDAINKNANVIYGGNVVGYNLLQPTLIDHVSDKCRVAWEEPFGPILPITRVSCIDEAIKIANQSEYGLQGSIFSNDDKEILKISNALDTGTVNINKSSSRGPDIFPFIGIKNSGFGVQGIKDSLKAMTRLKGIIHNI